MDRDSGAIIGSTSKAGWGRAARTASADSVGRVLAAADATAAKKVGEPYRLPEWYKKIYLCYYLWFGCSVLLELSPQLPRGYGYVSRSETGLALSVSCFLLGERKRTEANRAEPCEDTKPLDVKPKPQTMPRSEPEAQNSR